MKRFTCMQAGAAEQRVGTNCEHIANSSDPQNGARQCFQSLATSLRTAHRTRHMDGQKALRRSFAVASACRIRLMRSLWMDGGQSEPAAAASMLCSSLPGNTTFGRGSAQPLGCPPLAWPPTIMFPHDKHEPVPMRR